MRRLLAAFAFVALGLTLVSPRAEAHALLVGSDPAAGALLDKPPSVVLLTFTERPDPSLSAVHVLDGLGRSVEGGRAAVVVGDAKTLVVQLPPLERSSYTVTWRVTSSDDGHTTTGSFAFGVGVQPAARGATATPAAPGPSIVSVIGRWTLYAGLALLLGASIARPRRGIVASWIVAAIGSVLLAIDVVQTAGVGLSQMASTTTGNKLAMELAAVAVVGVFAVLATRRPRRWHYAALGLGAAAAMLARARAGHAAASSVPLFTIGTQWAHLVAIGIWVGGLPWLVLALRRAAGGERTAIARRFSTMAALAVVVAIGTGSVRAIDEVGSWHGLFHTDFGVVLLVKLALVMVVLLLAAFNRFRHLARVGRGLKVSATAEAVVALGVLAATAVLAGFTPSASLAAATPRIARVVVTGHDFGTTMRVRLVVSPGTVGPNHFVARVTDFDSGRVVSAHSVSLHLTLDGRRDIPTSTIALRPVGDDWIADSPALAVDGRWRIATVVETSAGGTEVPLILRTRQPPSRTSVQRTPGLPTIYTITAGTRQVQTYVDPGRRGANDVHFTYLDVAGRPMEVELMEVTARRGTGPRRPLTFRRLDTGHFVADADLVAGRWTFTATTVDGMTTSFGERIR